MRFHIMLVVPGMFFPSFLGRPPLFFFRVPLGEVVGFICYYTEFFYKGYAVLPIALILGGIDI